MDEINKISENFQTDNNIQPVDSVTLANNLLRTTVWIDCQFTENVDKATVNNHVFLNRFQFQEMFFRRWLISNANINPWLSRFWWFSSEKQRYNYRHFSRITMHSPFSFEFERSVRFKNFVKKKIFPRKIHCLMPWSTSIPLTTVRFALND